MRLHLDTDFAGDPDDACALAMVLGWPDVEITGITTVADPDGRRAGYVRHLLDLAGRDDVPVASGAGLSGTTSLPMGGLPDSDRYWTTPVTPRLSPPGAVLDLLDQSIERGATIAAIGPYTNLARLEAARPSRLGDAQVVAMGGWTGPLDADLPPWGPARDWNVQCDTDAAITLLEKATVTWVPIAVTARTFLRAAHLPRLSESGELGTLLARQAQAYADDRDAASLGAAHLGLPDDLLNFHHDPLACAVALAWSGVTVSPMTLEPVLEDQVLRFEPHPAGLPCRVVTAVDGPAFAETWLRAVEGAQR